MKFRYKEVTVIHERAETRVPKIVPEWELPILQSMFPVEEVGDLCHERDPMSISGEYSRLATAYGARREEDGSIGRPQVETVYGAGPLGIATLKRAMQASILPESTPVTPQRASPTLNADLLQALGSMDTLTDDLIGSVKETEAA